MAVTAKTTAEICQLYRKLRHAAPQCKSLLALKQQQRRTFDRNCANCDKRGHCADECKGSKKDGGAKNNNSKPKNSSGGACWGCRSNTLPCSLPRPQELPGRWWWRIIRTSHRTYVSCLVCQEMCRTMLRTMLCIGGYTRVAVSSCSIHILRAFAADVRRAKNQSLLKLWLVWSMAVLRGEARYFLAGSNNIVHMAWQGGAAGRNWAERLRAAAATVRQPSCLITMVCCKCSCCRADCRLSIMHLLCNFALIIFDPHIGRGTQYRRQNKRQLLVLICRLIAW